MNDSHLWWFWSFWCLSGRAEIHRKVPILIRFAYRGHIKKTKRCEFLKSRLQVVMSVVLVLAPNKRIGGFGWLRGKRKGSAMERLREMFRFIFPGRTHSGARPHSWPVIHTRGLSNWPEVAAQLEHTDGKTAFVQRLFTSGQCCPQKCYIIKEPSLGVSKSPSPPPRGDLLHFPLPPSMSESLTLSNLDFSSPHFSLVVGADNRGFILKPSRSSLSLLLTSLISIPPPPDQIRPSPSLLFYPGLRPAPPNWVMLLHFDSLWVICSNYAVKIIILLIMEGQANVHAAGGWTGQCTNL